MLKIIGSDDSAGTKILCKVSAYMIFSVQGNSKREKGGVERTCELLVFAIYYTFSDLALSP